MAAKIHSRNGFEYHCDKMSVDGRWHTTWYFRPVTERWPVVFPVRDGKGLKGDVEALLDDAERALKAYHEAIDRRSDVEGAERALEAAKRRHEVLNHPDYDPGGNTNNPGKVARAMREVSESPDVVRRAEEALEAAKRFRAELSLARKPPAQ